MAYLELDERPGDRQFSLNFNYKTIQFIRKGDEREPIDEDLRCPEPADENDYERAMDNPTYDPREIDFQLREDGCIDRDNSTGLSTYTKLRRMPRRFREEPAKLWMLSVGSPFPQEIAIRRINKFHFGFVPSTDTVKPSVFKEKLKCLPWKKYNEEEMAEQAGK